MIHKTPPAFALERIEIIDQFLVSLVLVSGYFIIKRDVKIFSLFSLHPGPAATETPESSDSGLAVPQETSREELPLPTPPTEEPQSQILSSLRLENQLLRSEVASLNREMASVIQRAKDLQDGKTLERNRNSLHVCISSSALISAFLLT